MKKDLIDIFIGTWLHSQNGKKNSHKRAAPKHKILFSSSRGIAEKNRSLRY